MYLLYLALAYLTGVVVGRYAWERGLLECGFPEGLWVIPFLLLPLTPLLRRPVSQGPSTPMRWPTSAGFEVPGRSPVWALSAALFLAFLSGGLRYAGHPLTPCLTPSHLAYYNAPASRAFDRSLATATVTGTVSSFPLAVDGGHRLHVQAEYLTMDGVTRLVEGELRTTVAGPVSYVYGQSVRITGRLAAPGVFDSFNYREHLARKGIGSMVYNPIVEPLPGPGSGGWLYRSLYTWRGRGEQVLNRLLPEPHAALANGMLLGIESSIPEAVYDQFNRSGTSHVLVISGSNIALIAGVLVAFSARILGRRRAVWPALVGIASYAFLVGGDAAVLRAALMGGLYVVATSLGRRSTALISLGAACWVMALANPLALWDVGFQLSAAATAGLILLVPPLVARLEQWWPQGSRNHFLSGGLVALPALARSLFVDGLLMTLAASLATIPIVLIHFGRLSVVSLLANFLILPVQPYVLLWGSAGVAAGLVGLHPVARLLLWAAWLGLAWTEAVARWAAALPWASLEIQGYGVGFLGLTYGLLLALCWRRAIQVRWRQVWRSGSALGWSLVRLWPGAVLALGTSALLAWWMALSQPDGHLHLHFLDVGQGDAIFLQTPSGRQVLIDGGSSSQVLANQLGAVMPFWDRELDLLVMTHPDLDHMGAQMNLPERFRIGGAVETAIAETGAEDDPWVAAMDAGHVPIRLQEQGIWLDLGDGVALWVLWPPADAGGMDDNEASLVLKLVYGEFSALLTGDAGRHCEQALLQARAPLQAQVLKVAHHGSQTGSSPAFIAAVDPAVAVIQVGENNYGHPHPEVLDALAGRWVLRNDRHGRVHIDTDGHQMWIEAERD